MKQILYKKNCVFFFTFYFIGISPITIAIFSCLGIFKYIFENSKKN